MRTADVVIVGGGPAGLAAAALIHEKGIREILLLEREKTLGGVLRQCIHDGFGLTRFQEAMSGPEYAKKFIEKVQKLGIPYLTNASVICIEPSREDGQKAAPEDDIPASARICDKTGASGHIPEKQLENSNASRYKIVTYVSPSGLEKVRTRVLILAMGCRERSRGALAIPGERPPGVFTAGVAQSYMNLYNHMPGKEVIILGSGDIGMIMARRLTLEGASVKAVFELLPYPSGLPRNMEQCLNDYGIPLYLNTTVTDIHGKDRLRGVTVSEVDENQKPIPGTEREYSCDTLILSVGLIPENELTIDAGVRMDDRTCGPLVSEYLETSIPGIFAAGNVLHVHDVVDFVSEEAELMAESAALYLAEGGLPRGKIKVEPGNGVSQLVPQLVTGTRDFEISLRVTSPKKNLTLTVSQGGKVIASRKIKKAIPAEMARIPVSAGSLSGEEALIVSAEEGARV